MSEGMERRRKWLRDNIAACRAELRDVRQRKLWFLGWGAWDRKSLFEKHIASYEAELRRMA